MDEELEIVRVDSFEFELSDGRIFEHSFLFEELPSLNEFNKIYSQSSDLILNLIKVSQND